MRTKSSPVNTGQASDTADRCTHVSLSDLQNSTYARDIDDAGRVAFGISTALVEQAEKGRCHVIDGEGVDIVERRPRVRAAVIEERTSEDLGVGIFRCLRIVEETYERSRNPSAKKVDERAESMSLANKTYLFTRMCNFPSFSSMSFFASMMLSRLETSREKLPPQNVCCRV